jgi:hypothetical protein
MKEQQEAMKLDQHKVEAKNFEKLTLIEKREKEIVSKVK